jgi:LytS/YehU family sensor histidine kinase
MLRFEEDEVQVQFKVVGENGNQAIEPGLLIPFVENAFKYGTEPERVSNIDVLFDLSKADLIQFEVKNKIMMPNTSGAGTGINATKKRLEIIYPDQHELRISNGDDFIVRLNIHTR